MGVIKYSKMKIITISICQILSWSRECTLKRSSRKSFVYLRNYTSLKGLLMKNHDYLKLLVDEIRDIVTFVKLLQLGRWD